MMRKSEPVATLMANPLMAQGINALTWRIAMPLNMPMSRRSSRPAPPISMHNPMKCKDSRAGHSQEIPNRVFEIQVDSIQTATCGISSVVSMLQVGHQAAGDDGDGPHAERRSR